MAGELQLDLAVNLRINGSLVIGQLPARAVGLLELQLLCQPLVRHTDTQIQIGVAAHAVRGSGWQLDGWRNRWSLVLLTAYGLGL